MRPLLHIYLDDHYAGAAAGAALAQRVAHNNQGTAWRAALVQLAQDIQTDETTLATIRRRLSVDGGRAKRMMALAGERVARLKSNGRVRGYSPLSRLLEVEGLMAGVAAKHRLWASLDRSELVHSALPDVDFAELLARADSQLELLAILHEQAAEVALGDRSASDMQPPTASS